MSQNSDSSRHGDRGDRASSREFETDNRTGDGEEKRERPSSSLPANKRRRPEISNRPAFGRLDVSLEEGTNGFRVTKDTGHHGAIVDPTRPDGVFVMSGPRDQLHAMIDRVLGENDGQHVIGILKMGAAAESLAERPLPLATAGPELCVPESPTRETVTFGAERTWQREPTPEVDSALESAATRRSPYLGFRPAPGLMLPPPPPPQREQRRPHFVRVNKSAPKKHAKSTTASAVDEMKAAVESLSRQMGAFSGGQEKAAAEIGSLKVSMGEKKALEKKIQDEGRDHDKRIRDLMAQYNALNNAKMGVEKDLGEARGEVERVTRDLERSQADNTAMLERLQSCEDAFSSEQEIARLSADLKARNETLQRLFDAFHMEGSDAANEPLSLKRRLEMTPKLFANEADKQWVATAMTVCARLISLNVVDERMAYERVIEELAGVVVDDDMYQKVVSFLEGAEYRENYLFAPSRYGDAMLAGESGVQE
ncbi:hypothetical protein Landi51_10059 [Colletotrichum acutatum]